MKRFLKTFTVRRHAMIVVRQNGPDRAFEVWSWLAADTIPIVVRRVAYDATTRERAQIAAIAYAMAYRDELRHKGGRHE